MKIFYDDGSYKIVRSHKYRNQRKILTASQKRRIEMAEQVMRLAESANPGEFRELAFQSARECIKARKLETAQKHFGYVNHWVMKSKGKN